MSIAPKVESKTPNPDKLPYWSWKDDDFIAQGKFSWLAFGEIFAAMAFYLFIASNLEESWVLMLTVCIAPILLLRSESSIRKGLELIEIPYESINTYQFKRKTGLWSILILTFFLGIYIAYQSFNLQLPEWLYKHPLWIFFWKSAGMFAGFVLGGIASIGAFSIHVAAVQTGTITKTMVGLGIGSVILLPIYIFGLCIVAWCCRFFATVMYLREGFAAFSQNWRETVLVSDIRHAPALLPQASKISKLFNVSTLFKDRKVDRLELIARLIISIAFAFFATLYRWNIKASALIWAPIALGLSPIKWRNYTELREQTSLSTDKWLFATSVAFLVTFAAILAMPYLSNDFIDAFPKWMSSPTVISFRPQPNTIRYGLLCLFSLMFAFQLFLALRMRTQHDKPLSSAADFKPYIEENKLKDDLDSFTKQANCLRRILKINTALAIVTVWVFAFRFALDKWPTELKNVVWDWLKPLF